MIFFGRSQQCRLLFPLNSSTIRPCDTECSFATIIVSNLKFDLLIFCETFEAFSFDLCVMNEDIAGAIIRENEPDFCVLIMNRWSWKRVRLLRKNTRWKHIFVRQYATSKKRTRILWFCRTYYQVNGGKRARQIEGQSKLDALYCII